MTGRRKEINLKAPDRITESHDLHLKGGIWKATGTDPHLVFDVADQQFSGPWVFDLVIDGLAGSLRPHIRLRRQDGPREAPARHMRQVGPNRYKLALLLPQRCRFFRLAPAKSECSFHIVSFTARPISLGAFLAQTIQSASRDTLDSVAKSFSRPMAAKREQINFREPYRAIRSHQLQRKGELWTATGVDPHLVYNLADKQLIGPWMLDLIVDGATSPLKPKIYVHDSDGFREAAAQYMRQVGSNRYKLALTAPERCKLIRLDPAECECSFRIASFIAKPISLMTFLARASRNGENRTPAANRDLRNLPRVILRLSKKKVTFEMAKPPSNRAGSYATWIATVERQVVSLAEKRLRGLQTKPLISVLMPVYNTPAALLDAAIKSVTKQLYRNWELCIADDASTETWVRPTIERWQRADSRIKVVFRNQNGHISKATNSAFSVAQGDWIALLDHDDLLAPNALAEVALAINDHPSAEIVYSDEDKCDERGKRFGPYFKPDWSYDLFTGQNYINHLTVHRAENIRKVGGWRVGFEGSQDYDLSLRTIEVIDQSRIIHIPKVLYHWRTARGSTALDGEAKSYAYDAGHRALAEHATRRNIAATVLSTARGQYYRLKRSLPKAAPLVSLVIPTRDNVEVLRTCVDSILQKTTHPNYEIIVVNNSSAKEETFEYFDNLKNIKNVKILDYDYPFNYSAINNFAVESAEGEIVGLVNNDVEVINRDWLTEMASHALRPEVGCVGAKLYYPHGAIQHAGVILGLGGVAGHSHKHFNREAKGYFGRLAVVQNLSAVTAACLLVRKEVYAKVGGLDEENLTVAFNDVDFCLRVRELGYLNVWTPFAELYHHESISRGSDLAPSAAKRFQREITYMKQRWGSELQTDPYYSVNLTKDREDFSLAEPREIAFPSVTERRNQQVALR